MPLKIGVSEAPKLVSTKTLLLKHYYRRQGEPKRSAKYTPPPFLHRRCSSWLLWGWCADCGDNLKENCPQPHPPAGRAQASRNVEPSMLSQFSGLSKRCFWQTVILLGWHPPFSSFSGFRGAKSLVFVGRMLYHNFRQFSSKSPVFGRGQNDRFPKRLWLLTILAAMLTN